MASAHSPAVHSVHFYDDHAALIQRLRGIVGPSLAEGNAVLIVATADHRRQLLAELDRAGVDVNTPGKEGRFILCDAKETLAKFMVGDMPDHELFLGSVGKLLNKAKKAAPRGLTVFGEMVAVLWEEGNKAGALELELLWNDLLNDRAFHLHCAYPRWTFNRDGERLGLAAICDAHTHVVGFNENTTEPALKIQ